MSFNVLDSLIDNDSIAFQKNISDWKQAIKASIKPLIDKKVCSNEYYQSIIDSTNKFGPYYILCPNVAMPHGEMGKGVFQNGISLTIFDQDIIFPKQTKAKILLTLCGLNAEVHTGQALPQIAALFEDEKNVKKILACKNKQEVIDFLKSINLQKYLNN